MGCLLKVVTIFVACVVIAHCYRFLLLEKNYMCYLLWIFRKIFLFFDAIKKKKRIKKS